MGGLTVPSMEGLMGVSMAVESSLDPWAVTSMDSLLEAWLELSGFQRKDFQ